MTVLVDDAEWPFKGDLWAHLVSDESAYELHEFANRLGIRRLAFQDDHYDVPAVVRAQAIELGARAVSSRVLVEALHTSGLRVRHKTKWTRATRHHASVAHGLAQLHRTWPLSATVEWETLLHRPGGVALGAVLQPEHEAATAVIPGMLAGRAYRIDRPEGVLLDLVLSVP
jgi:hypothetical protein